MSVSSQRDLATELPLKPIAFHILLALSDGERHGYALVKALENQEDGNLRIDPGNLYRTLRTMLKRGLIHETDRRPDPEPDDERRRYFAVTPYGRKVAQAEARRLERLVRLARKQRLLVRS